MKSLFRVLFLAGLLLCANQSFAGEAPLWEGIAKTPAQIQADKGFVEALMKASGGDQKAAYYGAMQRGWAAFRKGDHETAIRRFNQATLVDARLGEAYWGFALATYSRGDGLEVAERWFVEAEKRISNASPLHSDHGRVLEQSGQPERAIKQFEIALQKDANNVEAHIGMARALGQLGDTAGAEKHMKEVERLQPR